MIRVKDMDENVLEVGDIVCCDTNYKDYEVCELLGSNKFKNQNGEIVNASECFIQDDELDL